MADEILFHVDVATQTVSVQAGEFLLWQRPVSTSANGVGEDPGSYCTPRGWHVVAAKIGEDQPIGSVFVARVPTGEVWTPDVETKDDLILTRILWLSGTEDHNASTQSRFIYFHGTNHEDKIGQPASLGCIRLRNADMLRLFEYASVGTRVHVQ